MTADAPFLLAIDQGTTSTRAILFDAAVRPVASHGIELRQIYPANGWVEHDAEEIWEATLACCRAATRGIDAKDIAAIGITNQRETTLIWDKATGTPLHHAIVWQDRRTAERCRQLKEQGHEAAVAVERPELTETTALGAAYLAGLGAGVFRDFSEIAGAVVLDRRFEPGLNPQIRDGLYEGWGRAVGRVRAQHPHGV